MNQTPCLIEYIYRQMGMIPKRHLPLNAATCKHPAQGIMGGCVPLN